MMPIEVLASLLKKKPLAETQLALSQEGKNISWNTLNKIRSGDKGVQYKSLEIVNDFLERQL